MTIAQIETVLAPALRSSPGTFAAAMEAWMVAHPTWTAELNAIVADINAASGFVGASMAAKWVSGTAYADGVLVWSPITRLTYRRKGAGAGTTDPSADSANWAYYPVASQAEAEAGTSDVVMMSPLRTAQAIVAQVPALAASQAQMETPTGTTLIVTPANAQWHPGVAKAWAKCGVAGGAPAAQHNITSLTDDGAGAITVTIATDFSSADYTIVSGVLYGSSTSIMSVYITAQLAGSFAAVSKLISSGSSTISATDPTNWFFACYGDQ